MKFNKENLKLLRERIEERLEDIEIDNSIIILELGNCSFGETHGKFQLNFKMKDGDSEEESDLKRVASLLDLDLSKIYEEPKSNPTRKFILKGYKIRSRKNPFIVQDLVSQKEFVISEENGIKFFRKEV
tara:strand:+ start:139 stop:525 length:387 start_codon:yes stop_codon:yes gene_type:complete